MPESTPTDCQHTLDPVDTLISLIIILLTPMFLTATNGNIIHARLAAAKTLESYRTETQADLITVALIIAFGLAALGSLGLSMTEGLSIPMILRLRGSAQGSSRAADQNRRALAKIRQPPPPQAAYYLDDPDPEFDEAEVIAAVAANRKRAASFQAQMDASASSSKPATPQPAAPQPAPPTLAPAPPTGANPTRPSAEQRHQAIWANAFMTVATEIADEIPRLPPRERKDATIRAAALNDSASELLAGNPGPRPRPGDRSLG